MKDGLEELACLYYEVHSRFYELSQEKYSASMSEVGRLAHAAGYTINDLAQIVTYAG